MRKRTDARKLDAATQTHLRRSLVQERAVTQDGGTVIRWKLREDLTLERMIGSTMIVPTVITPKFFALEQVNEAINAVENILGGGHG